MQHDGRQMVNTGIKLFSRGETRVCPCEFRLSQEVTQACCGDCAITAAGTGAPGAVPQQPHRHGLNAASWDPRASC